MGSQLALVQPALASDANSIVQLDTGGSSSCILTSGGQVTCWGFRGFPNEQSMTTPSTLETVKQISSGNEHICALLQSSKVRCWGYNLAGSTDVPLDLGPVTQISAADDFTCALTVNQTVRCWGVNAYGQTNVPDNLINVTQISSGGDHSCALIESGKVTCWGYLGGASLRVPGDLGPVNKVITGGSNTCVLTTQYAWGFRCWGSNQNQQLNYPQDLGPVSAVSPYNAGICALTISAQLRCWGNSNFLGVPTDLGAVKILSSARYGLNTCVLTVIEVVRCWGPSNYGVTDVPSALQLPHQILTPTPIVSGSFKVGSILAVDSGVWETGSALSYQWLRNGQIIEGATANSYLLSSEDYLQQISVKVLGSLAGYASATQISDSTVVIPGSLDGRADIPRPILTGTPSIGSLLTVSPNTSGTTVQYRWLRNGLETGQVGNSYTLTFADLGTYISVRATYSKLGYDDFSATSAALQVATTIPNTACAASLDKSAWLTSPGGQPLISGSSAFGSKLSGITGSWTSGTKFCSYWYSNGNAIAGAMGFSYKSQSSDIGQQIQYVVIGTDKSGKSVLRYSQPITVTKASFTSAKLPKITGVGKVGVKLSGSVTNWTAGVTYSYQWLRNGNPINGAQSSTYVPTADDLGTTLGFQACGSKDYFETLCLTSPATAAVIKGVISPAPSVKIEGPSTKPGAVLTGVAGNWPSGVALAIQWFRDGSAIQGETNISHTITQADRGHSVTFQVTGTVNGYIDCVKVSTAKKIP